MKKLTQSLNSPKKIAAFVVCVILIAGAVGFATLKVGANVNANKTIGMDKGVAVALADAGFKTEEVTDLKAHYDNEDGIAVYEVDFIANDFEYDYSIKASDGTIVEAQREKIKVTESVDEPSSSGSQTASNSGSGSNSVTSQNTSSSSSNPNSSKYIGVDKAKSIALKDAGVSASSVTFTTAKLDRDDGVTVYEIEFYSGDAEYEYEINATSGAIRERDSERRDYDDDWDDDDWDDDHDNDEWDD